MGLRSWFTQVDSFDIFKKVVKAIKNNSDAYGINFILKLKNNGSPFMANSVLVAWSGDTSQSKNGLPIDALRWTYSLDELNPKFSKKPDTLGQIYNSVSEIKASMFKKPEKQVTSISKNIIPYKISVIGYPSTFKFTVSKPFKPFNYDEDDGRNKILLKKMYELSVESPCHAYEDYVIEIVRKVRGGEHWFLGS
jgi:hypothetical protein